MSILVPFPSHDIHLFLRIIFLCSSSLRVPLPPASSPSISFSVYLSVLHPTSCLSSYLSSFIAFCSCFPFLSVSLRLPLRVRAPSFLFFPSFFYLTVSPSHLSYCILICPSSFPSFSLSLCPSCFCDKLGWIIDWHREVERKWRRRRGWWGNARGKWR